ncbi:MAG: ABC transporter permease [Anaerocolumna sp.]
MKLINIISLSLKFIYVRKRSLFLSIIMCIIAFYLCINIYVEAGVTQNYGYTIKKALNKSADATYSIEYNKGFPSDGSLDDKAKELSSFIDTLNKVDAHGYFCVTCDTFTELLNNNNYKNKMQEIYGATEPEEDMGYSNVLYLQPNVLDLCDLEVYAGTKELDYDKESETIPLLVGYSFKDVLPVGTVLTQDSYGVKYKVAGILKENSNWLEIGDASFGYTFSWGNNLDGMFVALFSDEYYKNLFFDIAQTYYFTFTDTKDMNKDITNIASRASELGLDVSIYSVSEKINLLMNNLNYFKNARILIVIISSCIIIILLSLCFISYIIKHKNEFGILYANGIDNISLIKMIMLENGFILIICGIISFLYCYYSLVSGSNKHGAYYLSYYNSMKGTASFYLIITILFIYLCSSLISIKYLCKLKPVELLGGDEE